MNVALGIIIGLILVLLLGTVFFTQFLNPYREQCKMIKQEIKRAYTDKDRKYWERKLKILHRSAIPIYRHFFDPRKVK